MKLKKISIIFMAAALSFSMLACKNNETVSSDAESLVTKEVTASQETTSNTESNISESVQEESEPVTTKPTIYDPEDYNCYVYDPRTHEVGEKWVDKEGYTVTAYKNFDIAVESDDIYLSPDIDKQLEDIIAACEEVTGLKFTPETLAFNFVNHEYPIYYFSHRYGGHIEYSTDGEVHLFEEEAGLGVLSNEYGTVIHETLHAIVARNYCMLNSIFSEGYAEYYTEKVLELLEEKYGYVYYYNDHKNNVISMAAYGEGECGLDVDFTEERVSTDLIEEHFFLNPSHGGHEPSYYIVAYFVEKYGDEDLIYVLSRLSKMTLDEFNESGWLDVSNDKVVDMLKNEFSPDFIEEFYDWFMLQDFNYVEMIDHDFTNNEGAIIPGYFSSLETAEDAIPSLYTIGDIRVKNSLTIDYTKAIREACDKLDFEYLGISFYLFGNGTVELYDENDKLIKKVNLKGYQPVERIKATKIKFICDGIQDFSVYPNDDDEFIVNFKWDDVPKESILNKQVKADETIVIPSGEKYVVDGYLDIYGTLETDEDGIVLDGSIIWLGGYGDYARWKWGDIELKASYNEFFDMDNHSYWPAFRLYKFDEKIHIDCGYCTDLYITIPGKADLEDYFAIDALGGMYENARIYFNGKQVY